MSPGFKFVLILCAAVAAGTVASFAWSLNLGLGLGLALLAGAGLMRLPAHQKGKEETTAFSSPVRVALRHEREASHALDAHAETLLAAMMNGMREGILVVDEELRVIASNHAAREIFKQVEGELESHRLSELTRNPAIHLAFTASLNDHEQAETKVEMQGAGGPIYDLRVVPLRLNGETNSRGAVGVFFNITRLERLERVRQEFLSNVSHELRTPLTAIIAFVETLEDGAIEDEESNRRFLSIIRRNAERMHNLIDDILELSAIEAGRVQIEAEPLPLHRLVNDILTALASRAEASRIKLKNEVPTEAIVFADPRRLEQMLTNLTHNAIKFNREDGSVTLKHERTGERDRITVSDTGEGIQPEHINRIFERFYRVDRARSREMGGTGLGLAIVKHLARAHGGEVSVQSTLGAGSTFVIELPVEATRRVKDSQPSAQTVEQLEERALPALRSN